LAKGSQRGFAAAIGRTARWSRDDAESYFESSGGRRGVVLMILNILAAWTAVSIVTGLAIAPALARRLR
jgi:hypothetical protein